MSDSKLNHETFSPVPVPLNYKDPIPISNPDPDLNSTATLSIHKEKDVSSTFIFQPTSKIVHKEKKDFTATPEATKTSRLNANANVDKKVKVKSSPSPSPSPVKGEIPKVEILPISAKSLGLNNNSRSRSPSSASASPSPKKYRETTTVNAGETFRHLVSSSPKTSISTSKSRTKTSSLEFENEVSRVKKAIKDGHIFEIRGVVNSAVRESLVKRGWIEKKKETLNGNGNEKRDKFIVPKTRRSLSQHQSPNHRKGHNETTTNSEPPNSKSSSNSNSNSKSKPKSKSSSNLKTRSASISKSKYKLTSEIELWTQEILSRLPPNLIWTDNRTEFSWKKIPNWQYVNKLPQSGSVEKRGILDRLQTLQWFSNEVGVGAASPASFHPRTYRLYDNEEKSVFLQDYRLTACMSLLKWFLFSLKQEPGMNVMVDFDRSSLFLIDFALRQLKHYIRVRRHLDIDDDNHSHHKHNHNKNHNHGNNKNNSSATPTAPQIGEWDVFLNKSTQIIQRKGKLTTVAKSVSATKADAIKLVKDKYNDAKNTMKEMGQFWPQINIDGMNNVWIFKPGEGSLGRGIIVLDQYEEIALRFIGEETQNSTWLAQKYVENPLLVKKTKFDIRQWFLISCWNPLTVWMYRQSYIRFASTDFRLDDLSEKIHLTNASVQQKYRADPSRDWHIPMNNMWCSTTFQTYLSSIGKPNVWKKLIYPEMKKIILSVLLATRPTIRHQERTFQILGADFLLSDDYKPWLIEINSCPTMSSNTSVKRKLCPQCIEDTFKVILDWTEDDTVDTGDFDLLYRAKEPLPEPISQKLRFGSRSRSRSRSLEKLTVRGRGTDRESNRDRKKAKGEKKQKESQDQNQPERESQSESDSESDSEKDSQIQTGIDNGSGNLVSTVEIYGRALANSPSTLSSSAISMIQVSSIAVDQSQSQNQSLDPVPTEIPTKVSVPALAAASDQDQNPDSAVEPTSTKNYLNLDSNINSNNE